MNEELVVIEMDLITDEVKEKAPEMSVQIQSVFAPMVQTLKGIEAPFNELIEKSKSGITRELTQEAKRLRLDIVAIRGKVEKQRKISKEKYLIGGKAIDGASNIFKAAVFEKESSLKDIEEHFDRLEAEILARVQSEREDELFKYAPNEDSRNLSNMEPDVWEAFISVKKKQFEDRIALEKEEEEKRIALELAEAEEKKKLQEENLRLKKQNEEAERLAKIEADKLAKIEAEAKAKLLEAEMKLAESKRAEERRIAEESEKLAKIEAERLAKIESDLQRGDDEKLKSLVSDLEELKGKYSFESMESKKIGLAVDTLLDKIIFYVNGK